MVVDLVYKVVSYDFSWLRHYVRENALDVMTERRKACGQKFYEVMSVLPFHAVQAGKFESPGPTKKMGDFG